VRNLAGGEVEMLAQGSPESVANFEAWAAQGPMGAHVLKVEVRDQEAAADLTAFTIIG